MKILISGGPGSGCTSTALILGADLGIPVFDSDDFFHKPTDPPYQEQYSHDERKRLVEPALESGDNWILSGSVANWDVVMPAVELGIFLPVSKQIRLERLAVRERARFGRRIDPGGDMHEENVLFMEWAAGYEERAVSGRSWMSDRSFLERSCRRFYEVHSMGTLEEVAEEILRLVGGDRA